LPCTPGMYCEGLGNSKPTNSCDAGYYCPGSNTNARPNESECRPRYYCPVGSPQMTQCTAGSDCLTPKLENPTGPCDIGHFCRSGSLNATEELCPPGNFCPPGSDLPEACPMGKFLSGTGAFSISDCSNCTGGFYCNSTGLSAVAGPCAPGYFCPSGQQVRSPPEYICPKGHFCQEGSESPKRCVNGTYQDNTGEYECKQCETGYFCDNTDTPVDSLAGRECPMGHYCPKGTRYSNEYPCKAGTWSNQTGLKVAGDCDSCPPR